MQNATATPTPQTATTIQEAPALPQRPLTQAELSAIRSRRSEMSSQLNSAQNRRERLLEEIRTAPPGTEEGLRDQYQVLSDRIVAVERDIEASGQMLRTGLVPQGTVLIPPRTGVEGRAADAERGAALAATILLPIVALLMWRSWRRRRRGRAAERAITDQDARMERLEQAVDAIALEIERVGESQRYQTKVLAEANLMPAMGGAHKVGEPERAREFER
jgi:hypothetical protein